ncbi:MAG: hypothetical protein AMJ90_06490 [candidate division Zixibacteria bacterium SM23_73_2]|nr:MAG: hypothetical protein AMJ90_06490 [candidate division Zixibacteria bacterium SM23_73_2]
MMFGVDHDNWDATGGPDDMSGLLTSTPFSLDPGQTQTIVTLTGDAAPAPMGTFMYHALAFAGFYRGDANMSGGLGLDDAISIAQFYFGNTAFWIQPFTDHGDVDNDGIPALSDAIRVAKTYLGVWPASEMTDYARFPAEIPFPDQPSMFSVPGFMTLGQ